MARKIVLIFTLFIFLVSLSGCATARKQKDLEIQGLRNQISVLEARIQAKDDEIANLNDALTKVTEEKLTAGKKAVVGETKSRPSVKQIQAALKNAGYNPGPIDGRMGRQTKDAIKAFQKDNGLVSDARVGKETWNLLSKHLYKKVK